MSAWAALAFNVVGISQAPYFVDLGLHFEVGEPYNRFVRGLLSPNPCSRHSLSLYLERDLQ